jgi:hypothetical protein
MSFGLGPPGQIKFLQKVGSKVGSKYTRNEATFLHLRALVYFVGKIEAGNRGRLQPIAGE